MKNLLFEISYNGAMYHGYQVQTNALTITEVVQNAVEKVTKHRDGIVGCSRTDSGVHANSYYFNMKTQTQIPVEKLVYLLNNALPNDIIILNCKEVSLDFHARYDCKSKEYLYKIYNAKKRNPFLSQLALQYQKPIDVEMLNIAAQDLVGTHDFKSFSSTSKKEKKTIRTVQSISVFRQDDMVFFKIKGDGFLYNMVRIIVGTLLYMNESKIPINAFPQILEQKDRTKAGKTAPACGLYLNSLEY
ncbi:MAG: tRNA pseudouridine(38-40) synthase TruA [Oscillospiraceae bacterium]